MSIASLPSRLAFALFLIVTAFGAAPFHDQLNGSDVATIAAPANL